MSLYQPPEWRPHDSVWIGFPSDGSLWLDDLAPAQQEVAGFARAVAAGGAGERVVLVAATEDAAATARELADFPVDIVIEPFGDIWLRDTGPIIVSDAGAPHALLHGFNGWGGKYDLPHDDSIGRRLAARAGIAARECDWIFEGGAIDVDGAGLAITTEQCLLNPNRNPGLDKKDIEALLGEELGVERVLWLGEGLVNDHTDGHVDNLARFVAPGRLALPEAAGPSDPNAAVLADAARRAAGFGVELIFVPSAGHHEADGEIIPASHMNFYIGNVAVALPLYGGASDLEATKALARLFPNRRIVGLPATHILTGGGSFHCISQQVPTIDAGS